MIAKRVKLQDFNYNTIAALLFIALSVALMAVIPYQIDKPLIQLGGVGQSNLSAELFPTIVAISLFLLGLCYFFMSFRINQKNNLSELDSEAIKNVSVTLVLMAAYVPLMVNLGFVVGSFTMIFVMSTYFGNRNLILGLCISILLPVLIFVIFRRLLLTELPPFPIDVWPLTHWSLI
ncbi:MAG: tripartite tricarboxylate transporter TctB family protein [Pseudomonadota bacterium]|nr:tripartite tricarboxylate transporter TctB family protein [Pseudomonadota bacterium]